jgi:hypothetical protein
MKVGITTFFQSHNYGAQLQAYAMSTYLREKIGAEVEFIDYMPSSKSSAYRVLPKISKPKDLVRYANSLMHYDRLKRRFCGFQRFGSDELPKSRLFSSIKEFVDSAPKYDAIVTGSDQVFRYKGPNTDFYFLPFAKNLGIKSIAYAPSFGVTTLDDRFHRHVSDLLMGIEYLSCREKAGAQIIEDLTGRKVPVVMDPVFLLNHEQWQQMAGAKAMERDSYILCYALVGSKEQLKIAESLRNRTGMRIVLVSSPLTKVNKGIRLLIPDPREFINLFMNASYIVTDSFHGTAFSLLFRKPFLSYIAIPQAASRITDLLSEIGMSAHLYINDKQNVLEISRDYDTFDMTKLISTSVSFLTDAIGGQK